MPKVPVDVQLSSLPNHPGVYQFYDAEGKILYVGKAKNLKKRVSSYFTKNHEYGKTRVMVKKIRTIKHIVVKTESDALLLENNLIKKHQPRYNVLLRDDKSYPWICIKNELFPRIFMTRKLIQDGSLYFGPYTSVKTVKTLLELIKNVSPLRTCSHKLTKEKIEAGKFKYDLEYHLGNCQGACQGEITEEEYHHRLEKVKEIIKGNFKGTLLELKKEMKAYSEAFEFEKAHMVKEKFETLKKYQAKSTIVNPKISNVDVFSIISDETHAYINFLQVSNGLIVRSHTLELQKKLEETNEELLQLGIFEIRQRFNSQSKEIYTPFPVKVNSAIKVSVPKLGDKKKLLDFSERNAQFFRQDRFKQMKIVDPDRHTKRIMAQMKGDLRLSEEPTHIECFDNSNIQGSNPVAACVVFRNGKPSKKEYRHFNIKTVTGPDDFASMEEVVFRRYRRLLNEGESLPQLIVIDGGKGQLSSALKSLDVLNLRGEIAIIGIAKRLEEIYFPDDPIPLYMDKKSETLKIIQQLRNEAHRFGISFHRNKRSNAAISTELEDIEGIGQKTAEQLLQRFKSVKRVKEASLKSLTASIGRAKAKKVYESFH
ncbi:MAG: excinuclease ABC subunit UvrC [Bacteroidota bacterium]